MQRVVIRSDTSCLIILKKIRKLDLLHKLFGEITITKIIADEFGNDLPEFIRIGNPENITYQKILESYVDAGE